jgi:predicted neutral ceramidase superfamily lipid hydrolase
MIIIIITTIKIYFIFICRQLFCCPSNIIFFHLHGINSCDLNIVPNGLLLVYAICFCLQYLWMIFVCIIKWQVPSSLLNLSFYLNALSNFMIITLIMRLLHVWHLKTILLKQMYYIWDRKVSWVNQFRKSTIWYKPGYNFSFTNNKAWTSFRCFKTCY